MSARQGLLLIAGFFAVLAGGVVLAARRGGHFGALFGFARFLAPPLGLSLVVVTPRRETATRLV